MTRDGDPRVARSNVRPPNPSSLTQSTFLRMTSTIPNSGRQCLIHSAYTVAATADRLNWRFHNADRDGMVVNISKGRQKVTTCRKTSKEFGVGATAQWRWSVRLFPRPCHPWLCITRPLRRRQLSQEGFAVERNTQRLEIQMTPFPKQTMTAKMIVLSKIEVCSSRYVFRESVLVNLGQKITFISWIRGNKLF